MESCNMMPILRMSLWLLLLVLVLLLVAERMTAKVADRFTI